MDGGRAWHCHTRPFSAAFIHAPVGVAQTAVGALNFTLSLNQLQDLDGTP
jgi:hypothetical protein